MLKTFTLIAMLLMAGVDSQSLAKQEVQPEIVVTARSLKDTEADLKACLARKCPPDQDIKATLAHAENQFVEGDYRNARSTLANALGRNRKHKEEYPVEVSDLLRANGNIAAHLGEFDVYRISVLDMRDTLKGALKSTDYRLFGAEIEVADSRMKLGYLEEASGKYLDIERLALKAGLPQVAAIARLRDLSLRVQRAEVEKTTFRKKEALDEIDMFLNAPTDGNDKFKIIAEVLRSRLDRTDGNSETANKLIARYAAMGGTDQPVLLYSTPIKMNEAQAVRAMAGGSDLNRIGTQVVENRWVDIGFWIGVDGKVDEPEILRNKGDTDWADVVLKSIKTRVYAPLKAEGDGSTFGVYAIERYSLTAQYENDVTGSRIRQRSPVARIKRTDLTGQDYSTDKP
jgi:hypothetical protein